MRRIKNIADIVNWIINPFTKGNYYDFDELKEEFIRYARLPAILDYKLIPAAIKKYKKFDSNKLNETKKDFFIKLYDSWNCFCCYCGKDRITHFEEKQWVFKRLYDIEHFLPRSLYPDLSVNLLNWLPVCMSCNQRIKKTKNPLEKNIIFHPYFWFIHIDKKDIFLDKTFDEEYSFVLKDEKKRKHIYKTEHSDFFELKNIYLYSQDTFNTFDFIKHKREIILAEKTWGIKKSDKQFKEYFFKNYAPESEDEILKYSNGKLKKDLIDNLQI